LNHVNSIACIAIKFEKHSGNTSPKRKKAALLRLILMHDEIGAGEEIRTLDFNLGKVALYP
jgi:hypothetical protein